MTYFAILGLYILPPLLALALCYRWDEKPRDEKPRRPMPASLKTWPPLLILLSHIVVAVLYTTPWDNYLVATGVWWYDPNLVTGVLFGWVPIEEYTFFVVQTALSGLWVLFLARRLQGKATAVGMSARAELRWISFAMVALLWIGSLLALAVGWSHGTYLALELAWALPPILLQLGFGADILWHYRRLIFWSLAPATLYLCIVDALAIGYGTWTIDPAQSTGILVGNLPLEEIIFFLITNILVIFGMILVLARESHARAPAQLLTLLERQFSRPIATPSGAKIDG